MKICFDVQSAITQQAGVGRYARVLARHLAGAGEIDLVLFFFDFRGNGVPFAAEPATFRRVPWCPGRLAQLAWKTVGWPPFDFFSGRADVYHFPNFILPPLSHGKSVVTIHDMSFMRFPEFAEERNLRYLSAGIRETAERCDAIITDSRFSADEITEFVNVDPERVFPIHLGVSGRFTPVPRAESAPMLKDLGIDRPYVLTVGTLEPRKNIPFLVEAFELLTGFDGALVIAGMRGWKYEPILAKMRSSSRAADIIFLDYVPDSHLVSLYSGAELFALTSFYEGFGFPPLEAMACGTPVICAATGSLPEVLGDAAVLVEDFDADTWAHHMGRLLTDTELRTSLVAKGRKHAARFTWQETARRTIDVYREVAS